MLHRIPEHGSQCCRLLYIHNLLHIVARKNLMLNQKIEFISKKTTREKLLAFLSAHAKAQGSKNFHHPL